MRPYQTVILLLLIAVAALYLLTRRDGPDPRVERFADCYVELAILHELGDTTAAIYEMQKDSVLAQFGLDQQSFLELKAELDREPDKLVEAWLLIEQQLKERRDTIQIRE